MAVVETEKQPVNIQLHTVHGGSAADNFKVGAPRELCPGEFHVCGNASYIVPAHYLCGECYSGMVGDCGTVYSVENPWLDCDVAPDATLCVKGDDLWLDLEDPTMPWAQGAPDGTGRNGYRVLVTEPEAGGTSKYLGTVADKDVTTKDCVIRVRHGKAPVTDVTKVTPAVP